MGNPNKEIYTPDRRKNLSGVSSYERAYLLFKRAFTPFPLSLDLLFSQF